jgi:hypothetical protein
MSFGIYDSLTPQELARNLSPKQFEMYKKYEESYRKGLNAAIEPQNGENFLHLLIRTKELLGDLNRLYKGRTVVIFGHGTGLSAVRVLLGDKALVDNSGQIDWRANILPNATPVLYSPIDAYNGFYNNIREGSSSLTEITEENLKRTRKFLRSDGQLESRDNRRKNGVFGVTEAFFLQPSQTRDKMADFQHALKERFGDSVYLVDEDKLHFTSQGLELRWDDKAAGTKAEFAMHSDKNAIDIRTEPFASICRRANEIQTPAIKIRVAGLNWDPDIGIFWELKPWIRNLEEDPIMARRAAWDLPQPRPPHITAAYFTHPFSKDELSDLRKLIDQYNNPFGDIIADQLQVLAYEDLSFNSGYRALSTIQLSVLEINETTPTRLRDTELTIDTKLSSFMNNKGAASTSL